MAGPDGEDQAVHAAAEIGYLTARAAEDYLGCVKELISMTVWLPVTGPDAQVAVAQRGDDELVCAYTSPERAAALRGPATDPGSLSARQFLELVEGWPYGERGMVVNPDSDSEFRMPGEVLPKVLKVRQNMRAQQASARPADAGDSGSVPGSGRVAESGRDSGGGAGAPPAVLPIEPPAQIGGFRFAAMLDGFDEDGKPYVSAQRPRITDPEEKRRIREYLDAGELLLIATGYITDMYQPDKGEVVPAHTRTDGKWVWLDAVVYYLDEYDIGPEPEFYKRIVEYNYQCPTPTKARAQRAGRALEERQRIASRLYAEWQDRNPDA